jgi:hypothetical protein
MSREEKKLMVRIGRLGGRKRALSLTPQRRKEIAQMGGRARRARARSEYAQELNRLTQQFPELIKKALRLSVKLKEEVAEQLAQQDGPTRSETQI